MKDSHCLETGFAIWVTGLPASGKSSLTARIVGKLHAAGQKVQVLESDVMRDLLTPWLGYGAEARDNFYHLLTAVGELLLHNGINVIFDATAGERRFREEARQRLTKFIEVYVRCPLEVCEARDPKHIYEKARRGVYTNVPGIQAPYEPPLNPEVIVDSTGSEPEEEAQTVIDALKKLNLLQG
jgi:adenylylsulfate kinase